MAEPLDLAKMIMCSSNAQINEVQMANLPAANPEEDCTSQSQVAAESTPLSSFQLIQRRLIRPSPNRPIYHQQPQNHRRPLTVYEDCLEKMSLRIKDCKLIINKRLSSKMISPSKNARIEHYLDPLLLSEAAQKVASSKRLNHPINLNPPFNQELIRHQIKDNYQDLSHCGFDWPSEDLQAMISSTDDYCTQQLDETYDDDDNIEYYPTVYKSCDQLLQQDSQQIMPSQFNYGWSIMDNHDQLLVNSALASNKLMMNDQANSSFSLDNPADNFQSFDTTVRLFQRLIKSSQDST